MLAVFPIVSAAPSGDAKQDILVCGRRSESDRVPARLLANEARIGLGTLFDKVRDEGHRVPIALDGPGPQEHLEP
jgi:hypothetical protein